METKISKVKSLDKAGPPYARFKGAGETAQAYNIEMEDGTKALFDGEADAQPTVVGALHAYHIVKSKAGTEWIKFDAVPAAQAPEPKKVATVLDVPKVPDTTVPPSMRSVPAQHASPAAPVAKTEPVSEKPKAPAIPDSQPRKGVIKSIVTNPADDFKGTDGKALHKYVLTMEDGVAGNMWIEDGIVAPKQGDTINYTLDPLTSKGTPYKDGSKRIDLVPENSNVSKETAITRIACGNTAVAIMALIPSVAEMPNLEMVMEMHEKIATQLEKRVLGTND